MSASPESCVAPQAPLPFTLRSRSNSMHLNITPSFSPAGARKLGMLLFEGRLSFRTIPPFTSHVLVTMPISLAMSFYIDPNRPNTQVPISSLLHIIHTLLPRHHSSSPGIFKFACQCPLMTARARACGCLWCASAWLWGCSLISRTCMESRHLPRDSATVSTC